jgi:glycosyltransferase involved in cell wall biosynthesis
MIKNQTISLVIPCKNEAGSLPALLKRIPSYIDEIIVIDNNSSDNTAQVARKLGVRVATEKRHLQGIGYGFAHQKGLKIATSDWVVTMDGDGTYPMNQIKNLVNHALTNKLDVVIGSRFPLHNSQVISAWRRLGVWILNTEVKVLYNYPIQDILSGMWAVRRNSAKKLNLKEGDWNLSPEIKLAALVHPELNFAEYHIEHAHRTNGASKQAIWKTGFSHLFYIIGRRFTTDSSVYQFATKQLAKLKSKLNMAATWFNQAPALD